MTKWYLQSTFKNGIQIGGRIDNVWLFGIIGLFVLILASINFMNLSTARSEKRSLEVGIRKSIGSSRRQLIYQFLSESFLVVVCSFMFAISIVLLFLTTFNELAGKEITFPWTHSSFWIVSIIFIILTTLLSGSYPALYLSSFKPIKVLNRTFKVGKNTTLPRKILVITQFTVSTILIIGTLIVKKQIDFTKNRPLGIDKNQLIEIPTSSHDFSNKYELIRNELLTSGAVTKMSWGTSPSIQTWNHSSGYEWEHKPKGFNDSFAIMGVSYDYVDAVGMKITQGRNFSREFPSDSNAVILNRTAVKYMGLKKPIGKYIRYTEPNPRQQPLKIIGVVDDVINKSVYDPILPQMYQFGYGFGGFYHVKLNPNQSTNKNLSIIEEVFKSNFPPLLSQSNVPRRLVFGKY